MNQSPYEKNNMYSYQHRYHAGNFADLHKHLCLLGILNHFHNKPSAFAVLDAYAGEGLYHLNSKEAQKNQEYLTGFGQLKSDSTAPLLIQQLLHIQKTQQARHSDPVYPGSPVLIQTCLRSQDRAILIENHPQAHFELKQNLSQDPRIHIHKQDAIQALKAWLPLPEKRGLILLDPSYEIKDEYTSVVTALAQAHKKFAQGIYALWYPLLPEARHVPLLDHLEETGIGPYWVCEFIPDANHMTGLYGSGMVVINPPWKLDETLSLCLKYLQAKYFPKALWQIM